MKNLFRHHPSLSRVASFLTAFTLMAAAVANLLVIYLPFAAGILYAVYRTVGSLRRAIGSRPRLRAVIVTGGTAFIAVSWLSMLISIFISLGVIYVALACASWVIFYLLLGGAKAKIVVACVWVMTAATLWIRGFPYPYIVYGIMTLALYASGFFTDGFASYSRVVVAAFLTSCMVIPPSLRFYTETNVRPVITMAHSGSLNAGFGASNITWGVRAVYPACESDSYFVLGRYSSPHIALVRGGRLIARTSYDDGPDNFYLDCSLHMIVDAVKLRGRLAVLIIDPTTLETRFTHIFPGAGARPIRVGYAKSPGLLVVTDDAGDMHCYDLAKRRELAVEHRFASTFFSLADDGRTLVTLQGLPARLTLSHYDPVARRYIPVREATGPAGVVVHLQLFEKAGLIVVAPFFGTTISLYDLATLRLKRTIRADYGMRHFAYDERTRVLIGDSYFRGWLYAFDPDDGTTLGKIYIGRRGRDIVPLAGGRELAVVTSSGPLAIDLRSLEPSRP